ncbi:MAG TPA: MFS transporter [Gaiellaceae bacterium]|nr:MFS transporter [Gaiellaceae bacterium]
MTAVRTLRGTLIVDTELRRTLVLVSAIVCFETVLFSILGPLLPHLAGALGLSKTTAGVLVAMYAAGAFLGAVPSGLVAARIGAKATALGGLVLLGGASVLFGVVPGAAWLFVARLAQGVGCALAWTGGFAWLLAQTPGERRGRVVGVALAAAVAGALLGPAFGGLAGTIGTRPVFVGLAVPALALALGGLALPAAPPEPPVSTATLRRALASRDLLLAVLMIVLAGFVLGVLSVLAPLHLGRLGWTSARVGAIFVLTAAANTAVTPLVGRWSDRAGRVAPLRVVLGLCCAGSVALAFPTGRWAYAALVFAAGGVYALLWTPAMVLLSDAAEARGLGFVAGFALMNLAWSPGQLVGSAFAGAVAQATSDAVPFLVCAALCVISLAAVREAQ